VFRANGLVYLNEDEWEDIDIREKYPEAILAKTYGKTYGTGNMTYVNHFENSGKNRKMRRHGQERRS
jgi:hypothetical protein